MEDCWILTIILALIVGIFLLAKGSLAILLYFAGKTDFSKWANTEKDKVILHTVRGKTVPCISPFGLKLETYLRMANINHEAETTGSMGPKKKTPWISLNGQHMGDSQLIIDFLSKKFAVEIDKDFTKEQLSSAYFVRTSLDEHLYWGLVLWRWGTKDGIATIPKILTISPILLWIYKTLFPGKVKEASIAQGMGRHSSEELFEIIKREFIQVSTLLGNKKFILGNEPCTEDCTIFGHLAQFLWAMPGNPYEHLFKDECSNLKAYCERMKEKFYPDWVSIMAN